MDTHELAWAAGLFDGEGSTNYHRKKQYHRIQLSIGQCGNPAVLLRFQSAVGAGKVYGPYVYEYEGWADRWQFVVSSLNGVLAVLWGLWPYLSEVKREQAESALRCFSDHREGQTMRRARV